MTPNDNLVVGLDIGSSNITVAICEISAVGEINLKGVGTSVCSGVIRGKIEDRDELYRSLDRALRRAERVSGLKATQAVTNVPFFGTSFMHNTGFVLSKEESGQISQVEKMECIRRSKNATRSQNQTLMHVIPTEFRVDGLAVQNPVDVFGSHLEVTTHLVFGSSETIMTLTQLLKELGLKISGIVFDPLASAQVFLREQERESGVTFMDIGGRFTKVSVFKHNKLQSAVLVPVGGETFTSDVSKCLNVTIPEAERLKIVYGDVILSRVDKEKKVTANTKTDGRIDVQKYYLCQILEARLKELTVMIRKTLKLEQLPIVIGGGGGLLTGLTDYFRSEFGVSVRSGLPEEIKSVIENAGQASAIGLILYGMKSNAIIHEAQTKKGIGSLVGQWARGFLS